MANVGLVGILIAKKCHKKDENFDLSSNPIARFSISFDSMVKIDSFLSGEEFSI